MSVALYAETLLPELVLIVVACAVMIMGLSSRPNVRGLVPWLALVSLLAVLAMVWRTVGQDEPRFLQGVLIDALARYGRAMALVLGTLILLANWHVPRTTERGEFVAMLLCSVAGLMLVGVADDLLLLFFALELLSVPTYILIAISRDDIRASEAATKYFFLGALAAAITAYGFTFLYGATGSTAIGLQPLAERGVYPYALESGATGPLMTAGLLLALGGLAFKIAAVPFHFYVADVYQGAAAPVAGLLGFLPKAGGFVALIRLFSAFGWQLSEPVFWALWLVAAATMIGGNALGLLQRNAKRVLAYSSIAHSGYMLLGLLITSQVASAENPLRNGIAAVLFYLLTYGVMNLGAFTVLSYLRRAGRSVEMIEDLGGTARQQPMAAFALGTCLFGLMGMPATAGFWGKLYVFTSALALPEGSLHFAAMVTLVVIGLVTSAVGAVYYLRMIAAACFWDERPGLAALEHVSVRLAVSLCATLVLAFGIWPRDLIRLVRHASTPAVEVRVSEAAFAAAAGLAPDTSEQAPLRPPPPGPANAARSDSPAPTP